MPDIPDAESVVLADARQCVSTHTFPSRSLWFTQKLYVQWLWQASNSARAAQRDVYFLNLIPTSYASPMSEEKTSRQ